MRDHKSLVAWQEAHAVVLVVRQCCRRHWRPHASAVFSQLERSALSAQLNIAEGYAFGSTARFGNHLCIAYGSVVETIDLLDLLLEDGLVPEPLVRDGLRAATHARGLVIGLMRRYGRGTKGRRLQDVPGERQ